LFPTDNNIRILWQNKQPKEGGLKMDMIKKRMIYTVTVTLIVVFSTTFAILMTLERMDYRNYLQGEYSKNMYELINAVTNIEDDLSKSAIAGTRDQYIIIFQEIFRNATRANDRLHSLPIAQETLNETSKFLSQVGDYCFTLVKNSTEGKEPTDEDFSNIDRLKQQSYQLKEDLNLMLLDVNEGRVKWGEIRKKVSGVLAKEDESLISNKFRSIQKQVAQYPSLIYDGPFSDNVLEIEPKVKNLPTVTQQQAEDTVKKILGSDKVEKIELRDVGGQTRIESYSFKVAMKGYGEGENVVCEISKHGGKVVYLLDNRRLNKPTIDAEKSAELGAKLLNDIGYASMVPTYKMTYEDSVVINYIYKANDVIVYPDQIKLKIAMDDGSIIGIESEKYLVSHDENRNIPTAKVSVDKAKEKVSKRLQINSTKLAVIPTETDKEILCYEFQGTYNDDNFIVYINAENGEPQRILKIINTPNGQLTL
jgi:spore germination protein